MSEFTTPLVVELIGKNIWSVHEKFEYHVGTYPSSEVVSVPVGFITNFASVPRIFWPIISPVDTHGKAAVVHDYLYLTGEYTKAKSDLIFREALKVLGVNDKKVSAMYWAVRLFGWNTWRKYRKGD